MIESRNKKKILIVDDDPLLLELLRDTLASIGYNTVAADGGKKALGCLTKEVFDLLVTDIRMPGIDGSELLQSVRRNYPQMPVLFITGASDGEISGSPKPDGFLTKPFRICQIEELIEDSISRTTENR